MRRTTPTATALAAAALLLAGCGSTGGADARGGGGTVSPSAPTPSPSPSATSPAPSPSSSSSSSPASPAAPSSSATPPSTGGGCSGHAELTAADNGRTVCLTKGGELRLTLDGTKGRPWKPVAASGGALRAINGGIVLLPGDATAAYQAAASGTAHLTSSRPLCAQPTAPGQVSCKGIQDWAVTVRVR
ncbi:hypothetical protein OIB37_14960 [Streptomyces sp. NBC_00820]|uniref:hypothetical protein n=1 Tax=Streptomyces sp. NBC_00820 TaxID=2975842 RepID=UPI002ED3812A|nr:hypothetical protein OIB37_14960 [Streptomyces sp. NBC_00820]